MEILNLDFLFYFKSVVVIGVLNVFGKVGNVIMCLIIFCFDGKVYFVNVKGGEIEVNGKKFKVYRSVKEIFDEVDVVVIVVFVKFVFDVIDECGEKGVKVVVVILVGFKEVGRVDFEEEFVRRVRKWGIRVVGLNCLGVINFENGFDCNFNLFER